MLRGGCRLVGVADADVSGGYGCVVGRGIAEAAEFTGLGVLRGEFR